MKKILISFALSLLVLTCFFIFNTARAQNGNGAEPECPPPPPAPICSGSWIEYQQKCESSACAANILQRSRNCWWSDGAPVPVIDEKGCVVGYAGCSGPLSSGCGDWSAPSVIGACQKWQKCIDGTWSAAMPTCQCAGECLGKPKNDRYYDNPTYSDRPDKNVGNNNVYLPVKLDWDNVDHANSYRYQANGVDRGYVVGSEAIPKSCTFRSGSRNSWKAVPCCSFTGTNCKPWIDVDEWNFTTNLAPEPILPYDPDWQGPEKGEPVWDPSETLPVHFDWCDVSGAGSYYMRAYKDGGNYCVAVPPFCPLVITKTSKEPTNVLNSDMDFSLDFFPKEKLFDWEVATCLGEGGTQCGLNCPPDAKWDDSCTEFSQRWSFIGKVVLPAPELRFPTSGTAVNLSHSLEWQHVPGSRSYRYQIIGTEVDNFTTTAWVSFYGFWDSLSLATPYTWRVQPCWDEEGENCQEESWSKEWQFTTTGAPPVALNADVAIIPVKLDWGDVPGAASYKYEVATDPGFTNIVIPEEQRVVDKSEVSVDYPRLRQDTDYWWHVKTCADKEGEICGQRSGIRSFKTFRLGEPTGPYPLDGGEFYTYERYLRWEEVAGARAYQYRVYYGATEKIPLVRTPSNYALILPGTLDLGEHTWYVQACLDKDCEEKGEFAGPWRFNLVEGTPPGTAGLVPCGRDVNAPDPYDIDESDPCELEHLFLLLRNVLDFVLWRLGLIVLVLLTVATGAIFYFSMGAPSTIVNVKSLWKAVGMGYLIIFLAYTAINIFLAILGYKIGIFGPWWLISF